MFLKYRLKPLAVLVGTMMATGSLAQNAYANETPLLNDYVGETQLQDVEVKGTAGGRKRPNKVKKTADIINKEQVSNIRDLTRYDPGISVVEQGKGASKGYAIYGVDRNRVAINVDGLEQAESFELNRQDTSGARLEAEYEHVTAVDVTKGADSVDNGSGALGGAVSLRTKTAEDIVENGKIFGARYKTGYFSKDRQRVHSLAAAVDHEHFDMLLMHTRRNGNEYQANVKNAPGQTHHYKKRVPKSGYTLDSDPYLINGTDKVDAVVHYAPEDVVGEKRLLPDPMRVQSESMLFKSGLKLGAQKEHYLGVIGEFEKKHFNIDAKSESRLHTYGGKANITYSDLITAKRIDETHYRRRAGLEYLYRPQNVEEAWLDRFKVALNNQSFRVATDERTSRCSPVDAPNPDCRPQRWDEETDERGFDFRQQQRSISVEADKWLETRFGEHDVKLSAGVGSNRYRVNTRGNNYFIVYTYHEKPRPSDRCVNVPYMGGTVPVCERTRQVFDEDSKPIEQRKFYVSLSDQITFNQWLSADVGARWEVNRFRSEQSGLPLDNYRNSAYRIGLNVHPADFLTLGYKYSTGFRVPSAGEMYGSFAEIRHRNNPAPETQELIDKKTRLKPETSQMHEVSARFNTSWLNGNLALFTVNYDNLIGRGQLWRTPVPSVGIKSYFERNYNLQQTRVKGASLDLQADLHNIWQKIPDGLSAVFSVTAVKQANSRVINANAYSDYMTYPLDSLQPLKLVYGLDYNAPSGRWGVSHRVIYSKGKSESELLTHGKRFGNQIVHNQAVTRHLSKKWSTVDIFGYWKPYKNLTVNAGVYNLFNYQYTTWESARRTVDTNDSPSAGKVLLAPGRSFAVSMELKF